MFDGLATAGLQFVFSAIATVATLGLATLTKLPERMVGSALDHRLAAYKSKLDGEIEQLKARLHHFSDRGERSNQLEYEALTSAWEKFIAAHNATQACITRFLEHADFDRMDDRQVDEYLKLTELSEQQKQQIRESKDKNVMYAKVERHRSINAAGAAIFVAHEVLRNKAIFIPKELEDEFDAALKLCASGWSIQKTEFAHGYWEEGGKATIAYMEKAPKVVDSLKGKVRNRILAAYADG